MSDTRYRYGIIGTGRSYGTEGATGFGMANTHFEAFRPWNRTDLVAIAEPRDDNAGIFRERNHVAPKQYHDYHAMLAQENLDIVSVCTWPHLHAEMAIAAAEAGVKVIFCEKPIATTWADCKRMKEVADKHSALLAFDHQRRFIKRFQAVKTHLDTGIIGELKTIEAECGNLYDWGTHWLDLMFMYNNETPAEWVIGQIDSREDNCIFGAYMENQGIVHWKWRNGVRGFLTAGYEAEIGATHRLTGTEGIIEITTDPWKLRIKGKGDADWRYIEAPQGEMWDYALAAQDIFKQLDEPGYVSSLSINNAIHHTEVIFAAYESSRYRGRIDLPLTNEGNALLEMLEQREIGPNRRS